jgi:hypothetical protein
VDVHVISLLSPSAEPADEEKGWHRIERAVNDSQFLVIERSVEYPQYIQRLDLSKHPTNKEHVSVPNMNLAVLCVCFKRDPLSTKFYDRTAYQ